MRFKRLLLAIFVADLAVTAAWVAFANRSNVDQRDGAAIAVLWGNGATLGDETRRRLAHTIALWRDGPNQRPVYCIGGARPKLAFSGAAVMCAALADAGVPKALLREAAPSNDTASNIATLLDALNRDGVRSVTVVADPLQAYRGRWRFGSDGQPVLWSSPSWRPLDMTSWPWLWRRVHHEALAVASLALPGAWRNALLAFFRG